MNKRMVFIIIVIFIIITSILLINHKTSENKFNYENKIIMYLSFNYPECNVTEFRSNFTKEEIECINSYKDPNRK